jgi:hypothetical protein
MRLFPCDSDPFYDVKQFLPWPRTKDRPGAKIPFRDVEFEFDGCLERTKKSARHNPYLVVLVDEEISTGHGDIGNPKARGFIRQLVLISNQYKDKKKREKVRNAIMMQFQ